MYHPDCRQAKVRPYCVARMAMTVVLALLCIVAQAADIGEEALVNLTIADGLSGETVHAVMADWGRGIWIATNSGVNYFDGRNLHTFPLEDESGRSLEAYALSETADHRIYVATEAGLYCIEKGCSSVRHVLPEVEHPLTLMARGDTLYIGGQQGMMVYDGRELKHLDVDVSHNGLDNIVRQYDVSEEGIVWFLGRFDLNSYDGQTGRVTNHALPAPVNGLTLSQFACLGNGRFVVGTRGNGLYLCNLRDGTAQRVAGVGNIVSAVQRSGDGHICVGTDGSGAYLLDGRTLEVKEHFHTEGDNLHRLPSNGTYCYYRDGDGVNWFGFVRYGLAYTYHCGSLFEAFRSGDFTSNDINVRTYCRHGDDVVLGTQNGFYHVNAVTGAYRFFSPEELGGGHIVNAIVWYKDYFYIGTFDGGLRQFDPQTMTIRKQPFTPKLDDTSIGALEAGPDGRLWIGCGHGLMIIDQERVDQHFTEQNSRILGGLILSITFDQSGNAWLTGENGCSLYSRRNHEIVETTFPKGFFNQQAWMRGAAGHGGLMFFRTGPQTFYTNEQMTDFGELKLPVKFADKWCRCFVDDGQGHYLLDSERGIFAFSYDLSDMFHFGYGEGLRGSFINDMGLDSDGQVWVATSQGLFFTDNSRFQLWMQDTCYRARLINVRRGSDLLSFSEEFRANEEHKILLGWNMVSEVLQAEVMLPDYSNHKGRLYEYRIGTDAWQTVDDGRPVNIRRLGLGKHSLKVRLAGAEGTTSSYTITVIPTFWAILELVLLFVAVAMLWLWWRYRKNTKVLLSERNEIEEALIEIEHKEALLAEFQEEDEADGNKYQQMKMNDQECEDIVGRMRHYLETEHAYVNSDLKRADLARVLHVPVAKLSYVFSMYLKENYYEFINRYRLEHFKQLIAEGAYKRFTLTALSEQCGFRKSSFFSTFRKVEGMTPTEYLKKQSIKIDLN